MKNRAEKVIFWILFGYLIGGLAYILIEEFFFISYPNQLSLFFSPVYNIPGIISIFIAGLFPSLTIGSELALFGFTVIGNIIIFLLSLCIAYAIARIGSLLGRLLH